MKIATSSICHVFEPSCVGTKVVRENDFRAELLAALHGYEMPANGQGFVVLPASAHAAVASGDCERTGLTADDYVIREWRSEVQLFAKRDAWQHRPTFCAAIVYTVAAYCADPEVDADERARVGDATHVLVAVLASRGPKPTLSSSRFVRNLAGGNASFAADRKTNEELIAAAAAIVAYEAAWAVVSD